MYPMHLLLDTTARLYRLAIYVISRYGHLKGLDRKATPCERTGHGEDVWPQ
jgi:hypothetical protein